MASHVTSRLVLFVIFFVLVGLTALTVWVAYQDLGSWNAPVAVAIATLKAMLVIVIFMEMRFGQPLTWFAGASGVLFLLLLIGMTMADAMSRGWLGVPGK